MPATSSVRRRALPGLAASALALAGCGSSGHGTSTAANVARAIPSRSCQATVLEALGRVVQRVYREGVSSERTSSARHVIASSAQLRQAVEAGDAAATRTAARALVAAGHITNLRVVSGGRVLADVGGPAIAPLRGTIVDAGGRAIASYVTSVWSDEGFLAESNGISGSSLALRKRGVSIGGSFALPPGRLPHEGTLTYRGLPYQYTSFGAKGFPSGALRVYLFKSVRSTAPLCGASSEDTFVNSFEQVARVIYAGEAGARTLAQVRRVQADRPLLDAVARRDPRSATVAIERLLVQHLVRLRVYAGRRLLADVGGPYVLAPVRAPLRLAGRTIGSLVLSIQDDEGYLRLTKRLAGLSVLMYMSSQLVKNSLGPSPGDVPESGSYVYRGRRYRVFSIDATAFPAGPLTIRALVPIPYS